MAKHSNEKIKAGYNVRNTLINLYLLIMFTFFPLFLTNQYAHARNDKFVLYIILSSLLIASVLVVSHSYSQEIKSGRLEPNEAVDAKKISVTDIGFLCFFLFAVISTVFSKYPLDALTGNAGRNNGLLLLLFYLCVYFILTRFWYFKEYLLVGYLVFSSFVAWLAVMHYFYIDPFGLLDGYSEKVARDFGTTIGNKNTIATFMCLFLPVAITIFVITTKRYLKVLSGFSIFFAYTGVLSADSNSGYLGMAGIMLVMLVVFVGKFEYIKEYMLALFIAFASGKLLRLFSFILSDHSKPFEQIAKFLIYDNRSYILVVAPLIIYLILLFFKKGISTHYPKKILRALAFTLSAFVFIYLLYNFIYYSVIDKSTDLGWETRLFRFDEKWGTHRGYMWINGLNEYSKFDFFKLLFGSGPDTFYHVFEPHFEGLLRFGDSSTDCIHSEYLNYLVTQGIFGLLSYLVILVSITVRSLKTYRKNPLVLVFLFSVLCYAIQSVVNIYQPITTPVFFIFISLAENLCRGTYRENVVTI